VKEWLRDHDTAAVYETPPAQNEWYEVFHDQDVRLLLCEIRQTNTENDAKDIEIRWTIDGNVYFLSTSLDDATPGYIYRAAPPSAGGTSGLATSGILYSGAYRVDKRGLDFKVEVRITSLPGTAQTLRCWCVYETLEVT